MSKTIKILTMILVVIICYSIPGCIHANTTKTITTNPVTEVSVVQTTKQKQKPFKRFNCYIIKTSAVVHEKANKKSKIIKTYYKGKKFKVYAIKGKWYHVGKNKWIHKNHISRKDPMKKLNGVRLQYNGIYHVTDNRLTRSKGVVYYKGHRETFYSQRVLSGSGLRIPGRHVADDGTIRDGDGYICISCNPSYRSKGSTLMTSLGPAKVYDCGVPVGTVDVYVDW